jgi:HPt (histidine-containing phosphotransfer) domain-containing protein
MKDNLDVEFADLRRRFCDRAVSESIELEAIVLELEHSGAQPRLALEIRRIAHSLAGVSGIFGFEEISARAAELDELARKTLGTQGLAVSCRALVATIKKSFLSTSQSAPG